MNASPIPAGLANGSILRKFVAVVPGPVPREKMNEYAAMTADKTIRVFFIVPRICFFNTGTLYQLSAFIL
jgi:hypothetical protein